MITKTVTSGQRSATATIPEETKFVFSDKWNFYHVQNLGTGTVYIGMSAGVTAGNDGVIAIPSGGTACTMHNFPADSVYILSTASDLVQVVGSNSAFIPFKQGSSGGGGSAYILPKATANSLGGIQAKAKTTENAEAAIGTDNKMYVYVPTALSELSNDENFIKNTVDNLVNYYNKTNSYSKTEINALISDLNSLTTEIVVSLPTENISTSTIYLIQVEDTNNYVQWMYINSDWANLGSTEINLSNYYTKLETYSKTETDNLLLNKVDTVDGKGLSTNDFTTVLKNKLDGIAEGANNYILPVATTSTLGGVKVDGTSITIADGVISASGGGGGGGITETLLFSGNVASVDTVYSLSDAYTNYKFLVITTTLSTNQKSSQGIINCIDIQTAADYSKLYYVFLCSALQSYSRYIAFSSATNFKYSSTNEIKIYGVN